MTAVAIGLSAKLMFGSRWRLQSAGVIIIHSGMLLLFLGGYITGLISYGGGMTLPEGSRSSVFVDYHLQELAVIGTGNADYNEITAFHGSKLNVGSVIEDSAFPAKIVVVDYFANCVPVRRNSPAPANYHGLAARFEFQEQRSDTEYERNRAGIVLDVTGIGEQANGRYMIFNNMIVEQTLLMNGEPYVLVLRKKRYVLPYEIELIDFERQVHPGTETARTFSSEVNVIEDGYKRRVKIEMNEPLRHRGYTLYQKRFTQDKTGETSELEVVSNPSVGQWAPYISCIVACLGLLLHLSLQLPKLVKKREAV